MRIKYALIAEPPAEEPPNTVDVSVEVPERSVRDFPYRRQKPGSPLCVLMRRANHLGEINDNWLARYSVYENIEFVEVSVDEPRMRQSHDEIQELRIQSAWGGDIRNLASSQEIIGWLRRNQERTYKGKASMYSMTMQCLAWSMGLGTGYP